MNIMKNRLTELFEKKRNNILNIYFTAGYPNTEDTRKVLGILEEEGVDLVEIGMPYSDPLADGPTIQESNTVALAKGMSLKVLLEQLKDLRKTSKIPVILMGYLNPVMQYGIEKFCKDFSEAGVDGIIVPDLPVEEYIRDYKAMFEKYNLSNIFLITPHTTEERIRMIDTYTEGFIYVVSTDSTTGNSKDVRNARPYLERVKNLKLKNPTLIGFNIKDKETVSFACELSSGAIIGSAFIKVLEKEGDLEKNVRDYVRSLR